MNRKLIFLLITACFVNNLMEQYGAWRQVGAAGIWANTVFAASSGGTLYTIEKSGALYKTDPDTGVYT